MTNPKQILPLKTENLKLPKLEKLLHIKFLDIQKLIQSLIHRSYLNENKNLKLNSNERYEFLGDAVLELWASNYLFTRFPEFDEGNLTNLRALLVCTTCLAQIAKDFGLGDYIYLSKGEINNNGRLNQSILADSFESVVGAIYLDQGWPMVDKFLSHFLISKVDSLAKQQVFKDDKSLFQEIAQAKKGITPHYVTLTESGPDHKKIFQVAVYLDSQLIAKGKGLSKQSAQEDASRKATKILTNQL